MSARLRKSVHIICFVITMFVIVPLSLAKDIEKGTVEVSGGSDLSFSSFEFERRDIPTKADGDTKTLSARISYYIAPNFALGLGWEYSSSTLEGDFSRFADKTNIDILTPSISYNINLDEKLSLKLLGSIAIVKVENSSEDTWGGGRQGGYVKTDGVGKLGSIGLSYFLRDNVSLDALISYLAVTLEQDGINVDVTGVSTGVGMSVYFNSVFAADDTPKDITTEENATPVGFEIAFGTEMMFGDTTYSIGYPVTVVGDGTYEGYFPFSELEWPLDIWLARIDAGINIGPSWRVNGTVKKNISDPDDSMIDKDWLTDSNPAQLDVFSTSSISDFDALIFDFDIEWVFLQLQSFNLYAGLGYQYQKFEYDGQLIHQYSPSGRPGWEFSGDGNVGITYEMTYKMPYLLIGGDYQIKPNFTVAGSFGFSPVVDAQDEDHHLLRDKISKGDMDGNAYMIDVSGTYDFLSSWFVKAGFHYTKIDVDGDQDQSGFDIPLTVVYVESESAQTSGYLTIGCKF